MSLILLSSRIRSSKHFFSIISLAIPLILSAYTHLWNPIGFPAIWVVEGQYMDRAMHLLQGLGLHGTNSISPHPYDHPYFGQIFLATIFKIIGYPQFLKPSADLHSIEMLYLVPKIIMGSLAILDTFLVYMIAHSRYDNNRAIALIAATLFAVMPLTWILRKIFLESILLPFLLLSILFAVSYAKNKHGENSNNKRFLLLFSGVFLGLSIFTKIPAFTMIPLVGYIIFTSSNKKWKSLGIWFIPVTLIPLIWPVPAILSGNFDLFLKDMAWNAQRPDVDINTVVHGVPINSLKYIFQIDPILIALGIAGIISSQIKKNYFILLWTIPFLIFLITINFASFFHLVLLLPAFCIAASRLIVEPCNRLKNPQIKKILPIAIISLVGAFGLISTTILINTNVTSSFFLTYSNIVKYLTSQTNSNNEIDASAKSDTIPSNNDKITMLGRHWTRTFFWIPSYIFNVDMDFKKINNVDDLPISTTEDKFVILVDKQIRNSLPSNRLMLNRQDFFYYYYTKPVVRLDFVTADYDTSTYPFVSMSHNKDTGPVTIREFNLSDNFSLSNYKLR
jgi:dolichyl-phosphate-mannose-protein mannosyltransferase